MAKPSYSYVCQSCGAQTRQYFGRCPSCGDWNSIIEEATSTFQKTIKKARKQGESSSLLRSEAMSSLQEKSLKRLLTGYGEFDRVLGGGLVPGSLVLVGGDPGIGKSTLLLQTATYLANKGSVLYITAEESAQQVRLRWQRLQSNQESQLQLLAETDLEIILDELSLFKPDVAIIDSIQALNDENLSSATGSVAQVRECSAALQRIAKQQGTALLIVGHVTKEGVLAGPKVLEHLVDAVLTFEGDRFASHRLLRAVKNRYGATHELGLFEMRGEGLREISNPSEIFLSGDESASGVATIVACEGTRSIVVELQGLVNATTYASPRRTATGVGNNRMHQILAVLEKHMGIALSRYDCYLAVAGGLEVDEPAADLGIAAAIVSSFRDLIIPSRTVLIGEIGLGGQLRPVAQLEQRLQEAMRLGFESAVIPRNSGLDFQQMKLKLNILEASNVNEAIVNSLGIKNKRPKNN